MSRDFWIFFPHRVPIISVGEPLFIIDISPLIIAEVQKSIFTQFLINRPELDYLE
ncbi:hypothetical protein HALDL1_03815 [Halobacterium sp. DL1]|nr:hypothetical protein HALDL1_03815 [Halobacterium sp. DL1]